MKTAALERPAESSITVPKDQFLTLVSMAERAAIGSLGLHGILVEQKHEAHGRIAWVNHLQAVELATKLGALAGVEVLCD